MSAWSRIAAAMCRGALVVCLLAPAAAAAKPPPELPAAIKQIIDRTPLERSRLGVIVTELDSGAVVYAKNPDALLNPASNMKIVTSVAALARLGPEKRFPTEILIDAPPEAGVVKGHLHVRGRGDPSLTTERLFRLVRDLEIRGIREVKGDVVVDDTYFDDVRDGPGWEQDSSDSAYMAPAGAVSLNFNSVAVHVLPGDSPGAKARVELDPPSDFFLVENETVTGPPGSRKRVRVWSLPAGDKQRIVVKAQVPVGGDPVSFYKRISNPAMYAGETLKQMLKERGVKIRGKVRRGQAPWGLRPYHVEWSEPLASILFRVNKYSQNHMTEQLLKALGAEVVGEPGTWAKGVEAVEEFLAREVKLPRGSYVMKNGSGLNDVNRFSARQLAAVLRWAHAQELVGPELLASLPIAGVDGTTKNRMGGTDAEGRVRAKTGTLQNVTALSGYATALDGKRYVFSILVNDYPGRLSRVLPGVDAIGAAIASTGSAAGTAAAVALAEPPRDDASASVAELRARVVTYVNLGRAKDPRNATFLRSALRAERDPALRAVIADALHRSEPSLATAREVIESFSSAPEVLGRLRAAVRGLEVETPVLGTLVDLAADGNEEAIAALFGVGLQTDDDDPLDVELSGWVAEVARTSPDEVLAVLRASSSELQAAAVRLLARGLAVEVPVKHPFRLALAGAAEGPDPVLATFARTLESRIEQSRAAALPKAPAGPAPAPGGG